MMTDLRCLMNFCLTPEKPLDILNDVIDTLKHTGAHIYYTT